MQSTSHLPGLQNKRITDFRATSTMYFHSAMGDLPTNFNANERSDLQDMTCRALTQGFLYTSPFKAGHAVVPTDP